VLRVEARGRHELAHHELAHHASGGRPSDRRVRRAGLRARGAIVPGIHPDALPRPGPASALEPPMRPTLRGGRGGAGRVRSRMRPKRAATAISRLDANCKASGFGELGRFAT
jgi:hypothetical protein